MNAIKAVINFTSYMYTRMAYTSLFGVSLCEGFEVVKNFRFDLALAFSVVEYSSYVEKRTAMREFIVSLGKDRRDEEDRDDDDDDLLNAVYDFERMTAAIEHFVGWKGSDTER